MGGRARKSRYWLDSPYSTKSKSSQVKVLLLPVPAGVFWLGVFTPPVLWVPHLPGLTAPAVTVRRGERTVSPGLPPVLAGEDHAVWRLETAPWLGGVQPAVHTEHAGPVVAQLLDKHAVLRQPGHLDVLLVKPGHYLATDLTPRSPAFSQLLLVLQPLEAHQTGVATGVWEQSVVSRAELSWADWELRTCEPDFTEGRAGDHWYTLLGSWR